MAERTPQPRRQDEGCAHVYLRAIGPYLKCTGCGTVITAATGYDANCPDCEFELHRCGHCGQQLDHTMTHNCPKAYG
jgi:DNA-directed RNA polymerase subunit RPC12/RpoP